MITMRKSLLLIGSFLFYNGCGDFFKFRLVTADFSDENSENPSLVDVVSNNIGNTGDASIHSDTKTQNDTSYTPQLSIDTITYNKPDTTNYETSSNDSTPSSNFDEYNGQIITVEDCVSFITNKLTEWSYEAEINEDNWQINLLDSSIDDYVIVEAQIRVKIPEDKIGNISCDSDLYLSCKIPEPEYKGLSSDCPPYHEIILPQGDGNITYALSKYLEQWLE